MAEDYIYRDGQLLAGYLGNGQRRFFALDHLGTPRLITNSAGNQTGYHAYYPFGEEATASDPTIDRMQFTGHERDMNSMAGANPFADDLDYMHARYYNAQVGWFTSFDPAGGNPRAPQSWNRYAYVMGNREGVGVSTKAILNAVKSPVKVVTDVVRGSVKYFGKDAIVVLNNAGKLISTWPLNSSAFRIIP